MELGLCFQVLYTAPHLVYGTALRNQYAIGATFDLLVRSKDECTQVLRLISAVELLHSPLYIETDQYLQLPSTAP
jgi:hypothetical protein